MEYLINYYSNLDEKKNDKKNFIREKKIHTII